MFQSPSPFSAPFRLDSCPNSQDGCFHILPFLDDIWGWLDMASPISKLFAWDDIKSLDPHSQISRLLQDHSRACVGRPDLDIMRFQQFYSLSIGLKHWQNPEILYLAMAEDAKQCKIALQLINRLLERTWDATGDPETRQRKATYLEYDQTLIEYLSVMLQNYVKLAVDAPAMEDYYEKLIETKAFHKWEDLEAIDPLKPAIRLPKLFRIHLPNPHRRFERRLMAFD
ncbi:hypothetical protein BT63DRAFT_85201 [Microthyrium microscopicum]|uniref:Uncharacterized protein n=1 Tax=Microthyrium microscopicum TaxID=703497 RepID=A0A6A6U1F1_9PEZI|nr:hypothetical protein BT63DRAFT_85201 [Microthyrium microscopicum]